MRQLLRQVMIILLTLALLIPVALPVYGAGLSLSATSLQPTQQLIVSISGAPTSDSPWIGLIPAEIDSNYDSHDIQYAWLSKLSNGQWIINMPEKEGLYKIGIFLDDKADALVTMSDVISVYYHNVTVTASTYKQQPALPITVTLSEKPVHSSAWVGLVPASATKDYDSQDVTYSWVKNMTNGTTWTFNAPGVGSYKVIAIAEDYQDKVIGESSVITVDWNKVTATPSTRSLQPGNPITVVLSEKPVDPSAWVGIVPANINTNFDANDTSFAWVSKMTNGTTWKAVAPTVPGDYKFIVIAEDYKDTVIGESATFNVAKTNPVHNGEFSLSDVTSTTPSSDTLLGATAFESGVRVSWPSEPGIGYRVYRSTQNGQVGISVTDFYLTGTTYADVNVDPKTLYYYTVKPVISEANPLAGKEETVGDSIGVYLVTTKDDLVVTDMTKHFIILKLDNPNMSVDGMAKEVDPGRGTKPMKISGRTMVPIRAVVEALGGSLNWDDATQKITLTARGQKVEMWLGKKTMIVNGVSKTMDVAPVSKNGRTFVPVRFAAENLNCKVDWITSTNEAVIVYEE